MGQPRATRNACKAEATRQKKQHDYLGWRGRRGGKDWGKGEGWGWETASCPDFANLEKCESEYSCQTASIWRKLKYILLENKQPKEKRESKRHSFPLQQSQRVVLYRALARRGNCGRRLEGNELSKEAHIWMIKCQYVP